MVKPAPCLTISTVSVRLQKIHWSNRKTRLPNRVPLHELIASGEVTFYGLPDGAKLCIHRQDTISALFDGGIRVLQAVTGEGTDD